MGIPRGGGEMKIVIGVHHFPPDRIGGAELRAHDMAIWLKQAGHDVRVISIAKVEYSKVPDIQVVEDIYQGIHVHRLTLKLSSSDKFIFLYDNPLVKNAISTILLDARPDIFHLISGYLMGASAFDAAKSQGIPVVITLTDFWFICPRINMLRPDGTASRKDRFNSVECARCLVQDKRRFRWCRTFIPIEIQAFFTNLNLHLFRIRGDEAALIEELQNRNTTLLSILESADTLIFPSRHLMDVFQMRGLKRERMTFIPHGIQGVERPYSGHIVNNPIRIGYLGQIESHKGVHVLIEAFSHAARHKDMRLSLYGPYSSNQEYQQKIVNMVKDDPRIQLHGAYDVNQVMQILSEMDLVVIPSLWNEIGPLVLYEALRSKVPVIASNIPNMSYEIEHGKNGLLFETGNIYELAKILADLGDHPQKITLMSQQIMPVRTLNEEMSAIQDIYHQLSGK